MGFYWCIIYCLTATVENIVFCFHNPHKLFYYAVSQLNHKIYQKSWILLFANFILKVFVGCSYMFKLEGGWGFFICTFGWHNHLKNHQEFLKAFLYYKMKRNMLVFEMKFVVKIPGTIELLILTLSTLLSSVYIFSVRYVYS